jgi:hypothetical protein
VIIDGSLNHALIETVAGGAVARTSRTRYDDFTANVGLDSEYQHFDGFSKDDDFSDLQAQLCPSTAYSYAVKSRTWYEITISRTDEVQWEENAVKQLVLEESTKRMLVGLVKQHQENKTKVISDIIPSKGKVSHLLLLHSRPACV